jgi:hypothetical protein
MKNLSETDLDNLIREKLSDCKGYSNVCSLLATEPGKMRVIQRIKQLINQDGITSIGACLAQIESEMAFDVPQD